MGLASRFRTQPGPSLGNVANDLSPLFTPSSHRATGHASSQKPPATLSLSLQPHLLSILVTIPYFFTTSSSPAAPQVRPRARTRLSHPSPVSLLLTPTLPSPCWPSTTSVHHDRLSFSSPTAFDFVDLGLVRYLFQVATYLPT